MPELVERDLGQLRATCDLGAPRLRDGSLAPERLVQVGDVDIPERHQIVVHVLDLTRREFIERTQCDPMIALDRDDALVPRIRSPALSRARFSYPNTGGPGYFFARLTTVVAVLPPGSVMCAVALKAFAANFPVSCHAMPGAHAGSFPDPVSMPDGYA